MLYVEDKLLCHNFIKNVVMATSIGKSTKKTMSVNNRTLGTRVRNEKGRKRIHFVQSNNLKKSSTHFSKAYEGQ